MSKRKPTFEELITAYRLAAKIEYAKNERPCPRTVENVIMGVRNVLKVVGLQEGDPVSALTTKKLDLYLASAQERGHSKITARTYVSHLRALTAHWTRPHYAEYGWQHLSFALPTFRRSSDRYLRPSASKLARVRDWYLALKGKDDKRLWLAATLMLEFAMRNSDIARLQWGDFHVVSVLRSGANRMIKLCYTPHKTSLSSGRRVAWPVEHRLWDDFCALRVSNEQVLPGWRGVFRRLNAELRELKIFTGSKACYELRKICIDHVYQRFGAEMASSISGDDIRTVTHYYADPSTLNVTGIRIVDLL